MTRIRIDRRARDEIGAEMAWYDTRDAGLSLRLVAEVGDALGKVRVLPRGFPLVLRTRAGTEVRRVALQRFPFSLVHALDAPGRATVIALAHHSRRPRYWRRRLP